MAQTLEPNLRQASSAYRDLAFEALDKALDLFDPPATPLWLMSGKGEQIDNTGYDWEVDMWQSPQGALGPGDGYALQAAEVLDVTQSRRRMGNGGQQIRVGYGAGWIAELVPKLPGTGKGVIKDAYRKYLEMMKQNWEVAALSLDQTYQVDSGGANGGLMAGLRCLMDGAVTSPSGGKYANANAMVRGVPTDIHYAPTAACITGALANQGIFAMVKQSLKAIFNNVQRYREYTWLTNIGLSEAISGLTDPSAITAAPNSTPAQTRMFVREQDDEEFKQVVAIIRTDFGWVKKVLDVFIGTTTTDINGNYTATRANRVFLASPNSGYILTPERVKKRLGFSIREDEMGHDGGGIKKMLFMYAGLQLTNPQGCGFEALT